MVMILNDSDLERDVKSLSLTLEHIRSIVLRFSRNNQNNKISICQKRERKEHVNTETKAQ